uniref:Uncharacterized protein n=1 Tax=Globodera rostochiensis TaxID=31243 RepID=A0A914HU14_GLORO
MDRSKEGAFFVFLDTLSLLSAPTAFLHIERAKNCWAFQFSVACIVCTLVDIVQILLGIVAYFYPIWFRRTPFYRQILQKTERHSFHLYYNIFLLVWTFLFFSHILFTGVSILSVQLRRPFLFVPQLVILLLIILSFLGILSVSTTISVVSDDTMLAPCILSILFLFFYGLFLAITVACFQYLWTEYAEIQRILAKSKTVHFKEKTRKK